MTVLKCVLSLSKEAGSLCSSFSVYTTCVLCARVRILAPSANFELVERRQVVASSAVISALDDVVRMTVLYV